MLYLRIYPKIWISSRLLPQYRHFQVANYSASCITIHMTRAIYLSPNIPMSSKLIENVANSGIFSIVWHDLMFDIFLGKHHSLIPHVLNFVRANINIYLHFIPMLHIDMAQMVEIIPYVRQKLTYSTQSMSWLLMSLRSQGFSNHDLDYVETH